MLQTHPKLIGSALVSADDQNVRRTIIALFVSKETTLMALTVDEDGETHLVAFPSNAWLCRNNNFFRY